ncbi:hypothetical protein CYMTET_11793 [Cymbomonas tetramitiformis]|uniref:Uncharacterized protein n=1 Tax=Cymbomonas tetramitiformis TaxID=36881 RepID=A0AAE0GLW2_9CHLO|nr:hypothetical protein CYMTET_11793 [Cymbomonas tetramitiformis]
MGSAVIFQNAYHITCRTDFLGVHPIVKFVDICTEEHFATDWKDHDELVCPGRTGGFFCFRIRRISITSRLFARSAPRGR